ncbi:WD40 repeat protein [Salix suchowensis]|nr:WD40 repeat protein [Salix suchowensis]
MWAILDNTQENDARTFLVAVRVPMGAGRKVWGSIASVGRGLEGRRSYLLLDPGYHVAYPDKARFKTFLNFSCKLLEPSRRDEGNGRRIEHVRVEAKQHHHRIDDSNRCAKYLNFTPSWATPSEMGSSEEYAFQNCVTVRARTELWSLKSARIDCPGLLRIRTTGTAVHALRLLGGSQKHRELYHQLDKDNTQRTYYNSGIGTYAKPSMRSLKYVKLRLDNKVDLAIAWNFERIIMAAYRWLVDNYKDGDRIFLFAQISPRPAPTETQTTLSPAESFKQTFSRKDVKVHFIGAWDTVSSIGVVRDKSLPGTDAVEKTCCYFRHALALDERRVKFLPEYSHGGATFAEQPVDQGASNMPPLRETKAASVYQEPIDVDRESINPRVKEVWFPGTHSDMFVVLSYRFLDDLLIGLFVRSGGGNVQNNRLDRGHAALLWMSYEANTAGLKTHPSRVDWKWENLSEVHESLTAVWLPMEYLPVKRLSYKSATSTKADATYVKDLTLGKDGLSGLVRRFMHPSPFAKIHIDQKPYCHPMRLEDGMRWLGGAKDPTFSGRKGGSTF